MKSKNPAPNGTNNKFRQEHYAESGSPRFFRTNPKLTGFLPVEYPIQPRQASLCMNDEHDRTNQQSELRVPEGSSEQNRIREKIDVIKDSLKAQDELFRRLCSSLDTERALAMHASQLVWQERIQKQVRLLLETDLTLCEALRLSRLVAKEFRRIELRQNRSKGKTFEQNDHLP